LEEQPTVLNWNEEPGGVMSVKWSHSEYGKFAAAWGNRVSKFGTVYIERNCS